MGNKHSSLLNDPRLAPFKSKFTKHEMKTLWNIFSDLSSRDFGVINKETFLQFFSLTGLWGERLFKEFDIKHTGYLTFIEFLQGMATFCKCNEEEKVKLLFDLYDTDNDGFILKKDLVAMLYNYPKHYLRNVVDDISPGQMGKIMPLSEEKRSKAISSFDSDKKKTLQVKAVAFALEERRKDDNRQVNEEEDFNDLSIAEEKSLKKTMPPVAPREFFRSFDTHKLDGSRRNFENLSFHEKKRDDFLTNLTKLELLSPNVINSQRFTSTNLGDKQASPSRRKAFQQQELAVAIQLEEHPATSLEDLSFEILSPYLDPSKKVPQSFMVATTPNAKIKGYASHIFNNYTSDKQSIKMTYDEFKSWAYQHSGLLKIFDDTFLKEFWGTLQVEKSESQTTLGEISTITFRESRFSERLHSFKDDEWSCKLKKTQFSEIQVAGILQKKEKVSNKWSEKYVELRGSYLIYYSNKGHKLCEGILFLDGCHVDFIYSDPKTKKFGFQIMFPREDFKPHSFTCSDESVFEEWKSYLQVFRDVSINDLYKIHEQIGTGKFSTVWRVTSKTDKSKEYAMKIIDKDKLSQSEKQTIISETSVMKVLDHPTTIKPIDTIEIKNKLYIIMELMKDGDLFDYIISKEFVEEYEASFIMKRLLTSVTYLHNLGIIHRDLKPENIMITLESSAESKVKELKLIDFGFARFLCSNTLIQDACGTPNYLAPEILNEAGYNKKVDVFSLGVIMYFLLRGYLPFDGLSVGEILKKTYQAEVPLDDEHWENISPMGKDLVLKLLQKDPKQRIDIEEALNHPWIQKRESLRKYEGVNEKKGIHEKGREF